LKNLIIEHNRIWFPNEQGAGGGIYCDSGSIKAINLIIRSNLSGASRGGGGIYAKNSNVSLDNCEINNNSTAMYSYCEGLYFSKINFLIKNSKIENNTNLNTWRNNSGAVEIYNSTGSFINTIINDSLKFSNCNIEYNKCIVNGVIYP
jgi:hypothetical protein